MLTANSATRCAWSGELTGAEAIGVGCDVALVVDVLSFTTTLTVAADCGTTVFPYPWRDNRATGFAADHDATLAVGRSRVSTGQMSLSPRTVRAAASLPRLVLPSPNGSTISFHLQQATPTVVGVSLRDRDAAQWLLARRAGDAVLRVAVVAAGERWADDGTLRPAVEGLWGVGAVIESLRTARWGELSPEAAVATAAFRSIADDVAQALRTCASGRELIDLGDVGDVDVARGDRQRPISATTARHSLPDALIPGRRSSLVLSAGEDHSARRCSTPARGSSRRSSLAQLAVSDVEGLVVDQHSDQLEVGAGQAVRCALVEVAPPPDVTVGQREYRLALGRHVGVQLGLPQVPLFDAERGVGDHEDARR